MVGILPIIEPLIKLVPIIKLTGNVSIESPSRLLTGSELIADIDNNKRILNSANKDSLVEVLLENNANN